MIFNLEHMPLFPYSEKVCYSCICVFSLVIFIIGTIAFLFFVCSCVQMIFAIIRLPSWPTLQSTWNSCYCFSFTMEYDNDTIHQQSHYLLSNNIYHNWDKNTYYYYEDLLFLWAVRQSQKLFSHIVANHNNHENSWKKLGRLRSFMNETSNW